mmetsp:Transcript_71074/g.179387  ORF Transcript_71074/g.179387 Transcript_71074/m.179387 type:complete len:278 (-) Transcript_71074:1034-1867(-)
MGTHGDWERFKLLMHMPCMTLFWISSNSPVQETNCVRQRPMLLTTISSKCGGWPGDDNFTQSPMSKGRIQQTKIAPWMTSPKIRLKTQQIEIDNVIIGNTHSLKSMPNMKAAMRAMAAAQAPMKKRLKMALHTSNEVREAVMKRCSLYDRSTTATKSSSRSGSTKKTLASTLLPSTSSQVSSCSRLRPGSPDPCALMSEWKARRARFRASSIVVASRKPAPNCRGPLSAPSEFWSRSMAVGPSAVATSSLVSSAAASAAALCTATCRALRLLLLCLA